MQELMGRELDFVDILSVAEDNVDTTERKIEMIA